jgi:imidazolonepropionase-like amidohydrolase
MGSAPILRAALFKARDYEKKLKSGEKDPTKLPDTGLGMIGLLKALHREIPLRVHAHRADDIVTAVGIAEEFDIDFCIEHCTDGITVAEFLGARKARVNVGPGMWHRAKIETLNTTTETRGVLARAGCRASIISDHPFHPIQFLSTAAAMTWANGMREEDADFVVWSGHPFRVRSRIEQVYVEGKRVY